MDLQSAKRAVRDYFDLGAKQGLAQAARQHYAEDHRFFGVYPFDNLLTPSAVAEEFWSPLEVSFQGLERRQDLFIAGDSVAEEGVWVASMGHFVGLYDSPWLNIPANRRFAMLRYAEFNQVNSDGKIAATGMFVDIVGFMMQAGLQPLPPSTGAELVVQGPADHSGLLFDSCNPKEAEITLELVERMVADLVRLNKEGPDRCPPEVLQRTWHDNMLWWGPAGIGTTFTIERYQEQHQYPFREGLDGKVFHGHVCRIAEGNFAAWFGWPNLSNTPRGGFLGLPAGRRADMRVVDVYRRDGDKLLENWVLIDIPYWLKQQGLDILARTVGYQRKD